MYFWQGTEVATRYYASILMGHASAADLIKHIDTAVMKLSKNRIVQIGMDGPNVNWKAVSYTHLTLPTILRV